MSAPEKSDRELYVHYYRQSNGLIYTLFILCLTCFILFVLSATGVICVQGFSSNQACYWTCFNNGWCHLYCACSKLSRPATTPAATTTTVPTT
ncbi:Uu.00g036160.m01.CDS01 [Anthostomella pinea]|uniref:Uu.00g036160.m01.CDS01 n=1 Tax=Anthostomella pinea TaxID=933095 RepID=A0AAI8YDN4_9PEZI|nr:Uu.00g036160.m01.CDS01 [Anthostomella pinea]